MGMRVGGTSSAWSGAGTSGVQQRQQNVKDLFSALKAGDLAGAQKAMGAISGNSSSAASTDGPFAAISKALQSGDLKAAQQAAQSMHGHHHHHAAAATAAVNPAIAPTASVADSAVVTALGLGQNVNTTA